MLRRHSSRRVARLPPPAGARARDADVVDDASFPVVVSTGIDSSRGVSRTPRHCRVIGDEACARASPPPPRRRVTSSSRATSSTTTPRGASANGTNARTNARARERGRGRRTNGAEARGKTKTKRARRRRRRTTTRVDDGGRRRANAEEGTTGEMDATTGERDERRDDVE